MDRKPQPNHRRYLEALSRMTDEERFLKAVELTETSRRVFREGLRQTFPELTEDELEKLYRRRLELCHNQNW